MHPRRDINRPAGSLGRSQACNACLRVFGEKAVTDEVLTTWADRFLAREGFLSNGRKRPVPHEAPFQIAGYFYYYGIYLFHRVRPICCRRKPTPPTRNASPPSSSRSRKRTARGGTIRSTTTTSPTAPATR